MTQIPKIRIVRTFAVLLCAFVVAFAVAQFAQAHDANAVGNDQSIVNSLLIHAARGNDVESVDWLLENGADVNAKSPRGWTPLHLAADRNALTVARRLLKGGADVNAKNNDGWTPLDWAIREGHAEMQSLLRRNDGHCNKRCQQSPDTIVPPPPNLCPRGQHYWEGKCCSNFGDVRSCTLVP